MRHGLSAWAIEFGDDISFFHLNQISKQSYGYNLI